MKILGKSNILTKLIISTCLTILFIIMYVKYDEECYHLGLGSFIIKDKLPFGYELEFQSDSPQGFLLMYDDGFHYNSLHKITKVPSSVHSIKELISYYYNDSSLIIGCKNEFNEIVYFITKVVYISKNNRQIYFIDINKDDIDKIVGRYKYTDLNINDLEFFRFFRFCTFVLSFFGLLYTFEMLSRFNKYNKKIK